MGACALILTAQAAAVVFRWNSWPLTTFPMFSYRKSLSSAADYEVRGISLGSEVEFKIPTPESRALSGLYPVLIEKGEWAKLRDQVMTLEFSRTETREILVVKTFVEPNEDGVPRFRRTALLSINPATGEFEVHH